MNPIRALLWKEGREAVYKVGAGSCVAILLGLAYLHPVFNNEYPLVAVSYLVSLLAAVTMGIDLVAGERGRGTMPFLLSRPLAPGRLRGCSRCWPRSGQGYTSDCRNGENPTSCGGFTRVHL